MTIFTSIDEEKSFIHLKNVTCVNSGTLCINSSSVLIGLFESNPVIEDSYGAVCICRYQYVCVRHEHMKKCFSLWKYFIYIFHLTSTSSTMISETIAIILSIVLYIYSCSGRNFFLSFQMTKQFCWPTQYSRLLWNPKQLRYSLTDFSTFLYNFSTFSLALPSTNFSLL